MKAQEGEYHVSTISGWKMHKFWYLSIKGNKTGVPTFPLPGQDPAWGNFSVLLKLEAALVAFSPLLGIKSLNL